MEKPSEIPPEVIDTANQSLTEALNVSFRILKTIMVLLVTLFLLSGSFTVKHNEVAMVLRFGKVVGTKADRILNPGFHWTWPFPISEVVRVRVGKRHSLKLEDFLFFLKENEKEDETRNVPVQLDPEQDGYALARNTNIVHFAGNIEYNISDPYQYKMHHHYPEKMLQSIITSQLVQAASLFSANDILRDNPDRLRQMVKEGAQSKLDRIESGLKIINVNIRGVIPRQVREAFESATQARTERNQRIAMARTFRTKLLNEAIGESAQITSKSKNETRLVLKSTESDAQFFEQLLDKFHSYPEILIERHYQEALERVSDKIQEIFLLSSSAKDRRIYLKFNRNPELYRVAPAKEEE